MGYTQYMIVDTNHGLWNYKMTYLLIILCLLFFILWNIRQLYNNNNIKNLLEKEKINQDIIKNLTDNLPTKVLQTIQGSINNKKGKIGELVTLLNLSGDYERIIPFGKPIDFIGIGEESIDFIEVKTGKARLTNEEKHIKELIENNKVNFKIIKKAIEL